MCGFRIHRNRARRLPHGAPQAHDPLRSDSGAWIRASNLSNNNKSTDPAGHSLRIHPVAGPSKSSLSNLSGGSGGGRDTLCPYRCGVATSESELLSVLCGAGQYDNTKHGNGSESRSRSRTQNESRWSWRPCLYGRPTRRFPPFARPSVCGQLDSMDSDPPFHASCQEVAGPCHISTV